MKNIVIIVLNILALLPVLIYPAILMSGIMSAASPNASKFLGNFIFYLSLSYPIFLIGLVFLSRKYDSLLIAIVAVIPFLFLIYFLFFSGAGEQKKRFDSFEKPFTCGQNIFLGIERFPDFNNLYFLSKKNFLNYDINYWGRINNEYKIISILNYYENKIIKDKIDSILSECKTSDGKNILDVYKITSNEDFNKYIQKNNIKN